MLRVEDVSVSFGGLKALDNVALEAPASQITGLIGPNGAGKTTLFNVITGLQRPNKGRVMLGDLDVTRYRPKRRARLGLGRTFQRLEIFGSMSARDNILVALENRHLHGRKARARADELLSLVGLRGVEDTHADVLPTGMSRLLELARALACEPRVVLLDEPSSGLDPSESERLGTLLGSLEATGLSILLVEHDMNLVMSVCAYIYVLDFGRVIAEGTRAEVQSDALVRTAYLGPTVPDGPEWQR
jgi:branched-chain amino acid transport system ATP-binding protein